MPTLSHVAAKIFNTPLVILPSKLNAIVYGLSSRFGVELDRTELPKQMFIGTKRERSDTPYSLYGNIAVIEVFGILANRSYLNADSDYVLGYQDISNLITSALEDLKVQQIMLVIDSPGGESTGAFQLFDFIKKANKVKPIHAAVNDLAASGGYLIASACSSISITPTASVGSIGVYCCHIDMSKALENQGVKVTPIFVGAHKVDGNPYEPLPDDVKNSIQNDIAVLYSEFVSCVNSGRPQLSVESIIKTEAAMYIGNNAISAKLADRIETPDQMLERLQSNSSNKGNAKMIDTTKVSAEFCTQEKIADMCIAAGENELARHIIGIQITEDDLNKRLATAKEIRAMANVLGFKEQCQNFINSGASLEVVSKLFLKELADKDKAIQIDNSTISLVADGKDKFKKSVIEALSIRAGLQKDNSANEFRAHSLADIARVCLQQAGITTLPVNKANMIGMAITNSASDFPAIMSNVAERSLMIGYEEASETYTEWTRKGNLSDFKIAQRVGTSGFDSLDKIGDTGEYTHGKIADRKETIQLATYGKMFNISRHVIINDDLGALTDVPRKMGIAASRTVGNLVYKLLVANPLMSDGTELFHALHGNLVSPGTPLALDSLKTMRLQMGLQHDDNENVGVLNIKPKYLLVPLALEDEANILINNIYDPSVISKFQLTNPAKSWNLQVIADARLDDDNPDAYYLVADWRFNDTIEVAYLDGDDKPYIEQKEGWSVDGASFKVRLDAGVSALSYKTISKNEGI